VPNFVGWGGLPLRAFSSMNHGRFPSRSTTIMVVNAAVWDKPLSPAAAIWLINSTGKLPYDIRAEKWNQSLNIKIKYSFD
jgi:hypothetical protein